MAKESHKDELGLRLAKSLERCKERWTSKELPNWPASFESSPGEAGVWQQGEGEAVMPQGGGRASKRPGSRGVKPPMRQKNDTLKIDTPCLKRLPQHNETWEGDFRALPKPMMQRKTHYLGVVVTKRGGSVLAETKVEGRPSANDLATLLIKAMRKPLTGARHRPRRLHVRGHRQWQELVPHLEELGIKVSVTQELPKARDAYKDHLRQMRQARRAKMVKPTAEQQAVEKLFPAIGKFVQGYGHIEIGDQEMFGFVTRALGYGGMVFEDDRPETLAEAMAALENGLRKWFEEQGVKVG